MLFSTLLVASLTGAVLDGLGRRRPPHRRTQAARALRITRSAASPPTAIAPRDSEPDEGALSNRYLVFTGVIGATLAIATVVPAAIVAVPALAAAAEMPWVRRAVSHLRQHRRLDSYGVGTVSFTFLLLSQQFVALCLGGISFWVWTQLEVATRDRSRRTVTNLFGSRADTAWIVADGVETEVKLAQVQTGQIIAVRAGETIPVDGTVIDGAAGVDQQMLTGEDRLVELLPGDAALAATQVLSGSLRIRVSRSGEETTAGRIVALLEKTTDYRLTVQTRARQWCDDFATPQALIGLAALPFLGPYRATALMLTLPGPSLMLFFAPVGMLHTLSRAARRGVVIMDGRTLEALPQVDTVVFDKTGTLTDPIPRVTGIWSSDGTDEAALLGWAAAAEHRQSHPIALAVRGEAARRGIDVPASDSVAVVIGNGVQAWVDGAEILVGSARFMRIRDITLSDAASAIERTAQSDGGSTIHVARNGRHIGLILLRARVRAEAAEVVSALRARGLQVRILSGDGAAQTEAIARELGIDGFDAEVLPHEKAAAIRRLREAGRFVCFVGDGINDVVAMREAQVSVAVANASAAASAAAGILIYDDNLRHVNELLQIGDLFRRRLHQALAFSLIPDAVALGAIVFTGAGYLTALAIWQVSTVAGLASVLRPWPRGLRTGRRRRTNPPPTLLVRHASGNTA